MTAVLEQRTSSVNRINPDAFPAESVPVFTAFTAITSSETGVTWSRPADTALTASETNPRNGIIRWYEPVTGRWLSNDPIGISGGLNQYVFCNNNPVNFRDPDGRNPYLIAGLIALDVGVLSQVSVEVQSMFLDPGAIAAELQSNTSTMNMLNQVIESKGEMDWPDNFGQVGQMNTDLPAQGSGCEKRQKVRNLFESLRNVRGYRSAGGELAARLAVGAIQPLPKDMIPGRRLELAKALLGRQQAYHNFLTHSY